MLVTDLNSRERKRFANTFRAMSESAAAAASALLAGDDGGALVSMAKIGLASIALRELDEVFGEAANVTIPDAPPGGQL